MRPRGGTARTTPTLHGKPKRVKLKTGMKGVEKHKRQSMTSVNQHVELEADHFGSGEQAGCGAWRRPAAHVSEKTNAATQAMDLPQLPTLSLKNALSQSRQKRSWKLKPTKGTRQPEEDHQCPEQLIGQGSLPNAGGSGAG